MLVTHLAMALTRSERGSPLGEEPPPVIVAEAQANPVELGFVRAAARRGRRRARRDTARGGVPLRDGPRLHRHDARMRSH